VGTQSRWVRMLTDDGVVIGKLSVPHKPPYWFRQECQVLKEGYSREEVTDTEIMETMSPEDWLDTVYSSGRPIVVDTPLAPKQQEEFVLFRSDRWEAFQHEMQKVAATKDQEQVAAFMSQLDQRFKEYGALTIEERHKIPPAEADKWIPVPLGTFGVQGRTFTSYVPMVDTSGPDKGVEPLTRVVPQKLVLWNFITDSKRWDQLAARGYSGEKQGPGSVQVATSAQIPPVSAAR